VDIDLTSYTHILWIKDLFTSQYNPFIVHETSLSQEVHLKIMCGETQCERCRRLHNSGLPSNVKWCPKATRIGRICSDPGRKWDICDDCRHIEVVAWTSLPVLRKPPYPIPKPDRGYEIGSSGAARRAFKLFVHKGEEVCPREERRNLAPLEGT
jgi:hypothetical protein